MPEFDKIRNSHYSAFFCDKESIDVVHNQHISAATEALEAMDVFFIEPMYPWSDMMVQVSLTLRPYST